MKATYLATAYPATDAYLQCMMFADTTFEGDRLFRDAQTMIRLHEIEREAFANAEDSPMIHRDFGVWPGFALADRLARETGIPEESFRGRRHLGGCYFPA